MDLFWVVTLFHFSPNTQERDLLQRIATEEFNCLGIEEFSLSEPEVDNLLGERSYSGGDLPSEVLDEVESRIQETSIHWRFFFSDKKEAQDFLASVQKDFLCESQIEEKESQDWNFEWKKQYSPIKVNEYLEIIPSWQQNYQSNSREVLYIYPGMGFGTGSHETTFLCLKLLTEHLINNEIKTILDFGSGSGILGLATFKYFPEAQVDFYDIDMEANKNCYENAKINKLSDRSFRLLLPEFRDRLLPKYDLIFANILEGVLISERDLLKSLTSNNGFLIVSGLLKHQTSAILEAYLSSDMKMIHQEQKGDWAALLFQRIK